MIDIISKTDLSMVTLEDLQIEKFVKKLNRTLSLAAASGHSKCNICVSTNDQAICDTYNSFFDLVYDKFEIEDLKGLLDKVVGRLEYLGYSVVCEAHSKSDSFFYTIRITW